MWFDRWRRPPAACGLPAQRVPLPGDTLELVVRGYAVPGEAGLRAVETRREARLHRAIPQGAPTRRVWLTPEVVAARLHPRPRAGRRVGFAVGAPAPAAAANEAGGVRAVSSLPIPASPVARSGLVPVVGGATGQPAAPSGSDRGPHPPRSGPAAGGINSRALAVAAKRIADVGVRSRGPSDDDGAEPGGIQSHRGADLAGWGIVPRPRLASIKGQVLVCSDEAHHNQPAVRLGARRRA